MSSLLSRRRFLTRYIPTAALAPALGVFPDLGQGTVLSPDDNPGWAEEWPPTAHPQGRLWAIPPTPCSSCGGVHDCYTSGCIPILFAPDCCPPSANQRIPPIGLKVVESSISRARANGGEATRFAVVRHSEENSGGEEAGSQDEE